jgi:hypothetical protein
MGGEVRGRSGRARAEVRALVHGVMVAEESVNSLLAPLEVPVQTAQGTTPLVEADSPCEI